jgi:hypothetical protein
MHKPPIETTRAPVRVAKHKLLNVGGAAIAATLQANSFGSDTNVR